jgi:hypothetical protein
VSTDLESADHALQIKYVYLITKLTSRSFSERLKKVSCANLVFFVRVRTKYSTFDFKRPPENLAGLVLSTYQEFFHRNCCVD